MNLYFCSFIDCEYSPPTTESAVIRALNDEQAANLYAKHLRTLGHTVDVEMIERYSLTFDGEPAILHESI